jgi:hypothetical protein
MKIHGSKQVAEMCGCSVFTVLKYAQTHDIQCLSENKRKIYVWFESDIERFRERNKQRGRPKQTN